MREVMTAFHYTDNPDETPNPIRNMTEEKYAEYRANDDQLYANLRSSAKEIAILNVFPERSINVEKLNMLKQKDFEYIPYPAAGVDEIRTIGNWGEFPLMVKVVLDYFGIDVSIEDLTRIAVWGDWHHKNGTWHHFIDVMLSAYKLSPLRIDSFSKVFFRTRQDSVVIALLKHKLFPEGNGNALVLITRVNCGEVEVYHPAYGNQLITLNWSTFALNTLKLWSVWKD